MGLQALALQLHTACFHLKKENVAKERFGMHAKVQKRFLFGDPSERPVNGGLQGASSSPEDPSPGPSVPETKLVVCMSACAPPTKGVGSGANVQLNINIVILTEHTTGILHTQPSLPLVPGKHLLSHFK